MRSPQVLQLIMDSLRYWVQEMHVDGFRFDLASALARELYDVDRLGELLRHHPPGPGLSQVKLIAEPWDLGEGGYQVGQLPGAVDRMERQVSRLRPPLLAGRRRHRLGTGHAAVRQQRSLRTQRPQAVREHQLRHLLTTASRCTISSATTRSTTKPTARTTATASRHNLSWNCGAEGPTDDPEILALRATAEAQLPRHAAAVAGRADALPRRRARPHAARQQQRLLPRQRADVARLEPDRRAEGALRLHPTARAACDCRNRCFGGGSTSRAAASAAARTWPGSPPMGAR